MSMNSIRGLRRPSPLEEQAELFPGYRRAGSYQCHFRLAQVAAGFRRFITKRYKNGGGRSLRLSVASPKSKDEAERRKAHPGVR
jgi:hypothetical protein